MKAAETSVLYNSTPVHRMLYCVKVTAETDKNVSAVTIFLKDFQGL